MGKHHDTLGVKPDATLDQMKKAFYKLSKKYHPDLYPDDKKKEAKFKAISEAWTALQKGDDGDDRDEKAREYARRHFQDSGFAAAMAGMVHEGFVVNQFAKVGEKGANVEIEMDVPIRKLFTGGELNWQGQIPTMTKTGFGYVPRQKKLKLEPNTPVGTVFMFPGEGCRGIDGTVGDLAIVVGAQRDGIYECQGLNLVVRGKIPSVDAIIGKTKKFKLPNGEVQEFDVPIGTQNNSVVQIPNAGLKHVSGKVGKLIIVFELYTPKFTPEQREKIASLLETFNEESSKI